jgi:hypothetical protein
MSKNINIPESLLRKMYYEDGLTQEEIAAKFDCGATTVSRLMRGYNIKSRTANDYRRIELPYDELYQLYVVQGLSADAVGIHFGCCDGTILKQLEIHNIPVRPNSQPRAQHVPPSVYATWNADLAWAVGILASDGCLPKDCNAIKLSSTEIEIIENFMGCLQLDPAIEPFVQHNKNYKPLYILQFYDMNFRIFLENIGMMPAKSKRLGPLAIPDQVFADYARGAWDGDGCWRIERKHRKSGRVVGYLNTSLASGSPVYLQWMQNKIEQLVSLSGSIRGITLTYCGTKAISLGHWMYYASNLPALSYKKAIWKQFV